MVSCTIHIFWIWKSPQPNYVAITDTILDYLRQQGVEAVAACDYEEKLRKQ